MNSPDRTTIEAIAHRKVVHAMYNRTDVALAPHSLVMRHGSLYVSAVSNRRKLRDGNQPWLGLFKLSGLSDLVLTHETFEAMDIDGMELREGNEIIFGIEPA